VLFAHGILTQQSLASDYRYFLNAYQINFLSIVELTLGIKAKLSNAQVIFISSVAGDRGRGSNFAYGCAKAALSSFAEGLRAELLAQNTHVLVVKPGIVATPMTYHLHKGVAPDVVARDMIKAVKHRWHTLYSPWYWQAVMFVIRMIPPGLFKRWNI
jgi:short-subunit dehydrogenase